MRFHFAPAIAVILGCLPGISPNALAATAVAPPGVNVPAPCNVGGTAGLRTCAHYFYGNDPLMMTPPVLGGTPVPDPGTLNLLENRFQTQLDAVLLGKYPDIPNPIPPNYTPVPVVHGSSSGLFNNRILFDTDSPPGLPFGPFGPTVCDITGATILNLGATPPTNVTYPPQFGATNCGDPMQIVVEPNIRTGIQENASNPPPAGSACVCLDNSKNPILDSNNQPILTLDKNGKCTSNGNAPSCSSPSDHSTRTPWYTCITGASPSTTLNLARPASTQENAYMQGAYGSALACFYNAKVNEILANNSLNVDGMPYNPGTLGASECLAQANTLKFLTNSTISQLAALTSTVGSGVMADIVNCKKTWSNDDPTLNNPQISSLRQQAQHLCAMRADMEEAFLRLTECQIFALAKTAWNNVIVDNQETYWQNTIQDKVGTPCGKYCKYFMANKVFSNPKNVQTGSSLSSSLSAGLTAVKCFVCGLPLVPCTPSDVGSWCDVSDQCPVFSPYPPDNGQGNIQNFENDAAHWKGTPPSTENSAQDDINQCVNQCYQHGVTGGYINAPSPLDATPTLKTKFYIAPGTSDGTNTIQTDIPSFQSAITTYLSTQWPDATTKNPSSIQMSDCALAAPK